MSRLLALLLTALLALAVAAPVASAGSKSKSSSSKSSTSSKSTKKKSKSKSASDCDAEDWATGDDDCDGYELVDGVPQKKSSCGGLGMAPFALGGGLAGRLAIRRRRRR